MIKKWHCFKFYFNSIKWVFSAEELTIHFTKNHFQDPILGQKVTWI